VAVSNENVDSCCILCLKERPKLQSLDSYEMMSVQYFLDFSKGRIAEMTVISLTFLYQIIYEFTSFLVIGRDVHDTFQPETEIETKTFSLETETRPRHCQAIPRQGCPRSRRDRDEPLVRLETVSRRGIRDQDHIYDTY
jgi:hypothetical protein